MTRALSNSTVDPIDLTDQLMPAKATKRSHCCSGKNGRRGCNRSENRNAKQNRSHRSRTRAFREERNIR